MHLAGKIDRSLALEQIMLIGSSLRLTNSNRNALRQDEQNTKRHGTGDLGPCDHGGAFHNSILIKSLLQILR